MRLPRGRRGVERNDEPVSDPQRGAGGARVEGEERASIHAQHRAALGVIPGQAIAVSCPPVRSMALLVWIACWNAVRARLYLCQLVL